MATRTIFLEGEEVLRKTSRTITDFNKKLWDLLDDMAETMHKAEGVGLAAPQVGLLRRAVVIDVGEGVVELINPVIVASRGSQTDKEGCLSCPGEFGIVTRPYKVKVRAQNRHGEDIKLVATELFARAICHEVDHLEGVIFKDVASEMVDPNSKK